MTLPLVRLHGSPFDQGVQHGAALRERIDHNLTLYFARFERELKLSRAETLSRAERYAAVLATQSPAYHAGMRGIAEGSGFAFPEIAALNVRYELFYDEFAEKPMPDGCTAFALLPDATASGHLLIGENWDWIAGIKGAVLHTLESDSLQTLAFTEAGIFGGKIGLNSAGLGLAINGLLSTDDDWSRLHLPFHARCYEILRRGKLAEALQVITATDRSCSTNFLLAQAPASAINVETSPTGVGLTSCEVGCLVHANHFVDPAMLGVVERNVETNPHSLARHARLQQLLISSAPITLEALHSAMRDHAGHPYSVCFHIDPAEPPEEHYESVVSVIMDLNALTLAITDGPPCQSAYLTYSL